MTTPLLLLHAANQSALAPTGRQALLIDNLWWQFFAITGTVYLLVMLVLLGVAKRSRRDDVAATDPTLSDPPRDRKLTRVVTTLVAITAVILFGLMLSDFFTGRRYHALSATTDLHLKLTGRQWWWEVQYLDAGNPSNQVTTANEIVLPIGATVRIDLDARDVIHSLYIPSLAGKKDLIPGHPTSVWIRPDQVGTFEGQCYEFCGLAHAKMRLLVRVVSQEEYDAWHKNELADAVEPTTDLQKRGRDVFLSSTCVMCHTVLGTPAQGMVGPNLTHIGGRSTLAAASLPNDEAHLSAWIVNPQATKPGVRMPQHQFNDDDLHAMTAYLEALK
ncbi:MAG: cytochrome c oxidase subunit II [Tepidisphaeraceae bacterium]